MRNFHSVIPSRFVFNWENDWDVPFSGEKYLSIRRALFRLMEVNEANPMLSPSEERVLQDFDDFVVQASGKGLFDEVPNTLFFYANCNTGVSLAVVACTSWEYSGQMRMHPDC